MSDLVERLQQQAGLSPEQASKAIQVFAEFMENRVSDEQLREIAGQVPGLGKFADKLPSDLGDTLGGAARGLLRKRGD